MRKPLQLHLRHYTLSRLFPFVSQPHCFCMSSDAAVLQDGEMRCPRGHHCVERGHRSAGGGARVQQRVRAPRRALRASHPRAHFCAGGLRATAGEREQARRQPRTHQGRVGSQTARGASRERERERESDKEAEDLLNSATILRGSNFFSFMYLFVAFTNDLHALFLARCAACHRSSWALVVANS